MFTGNKLEDDFRRPSTSTSFNSQIVTEKIKYRQKLFEIEGAVEQCSCRRNRFFFVLINDDDDV